MNKLDKQYTDLLQDILDNGTRKMDRTGTGTISVFGRQIRHKMSEGFPLLTTKKLHFKSIVVELLWFLRGDTNIKFLVDNDCHIWDGDAYKSYENKYYKGEAFGYKKLNDSGYSPDLKLSQEEFINKIKTNDEFAKKWGELGPVYGKQWRSWTVPRMDPNGFDFDTAWEKSQKIWKSSNGMECGPSFGTFCMSLLRSKGMGIVYGYHTQIDQIATLINDLKTNPDSRRLMVNAWNVGELDLMTLPPCHYGFQVYTRELSLEERLDLFKVDSIDRIDSYDKWLDDNGYPKRAISLMWNQRSVDTFLGVPFNIASYGLLLEIIAKEVNMIPDELIGNLGDTHLYSNHIEQAKEQITREPYSLPTITLPSSLQPNSGNWDKLVFEDFYLNDYQSHPAIKAPLSN
jgi:thymidylate synthase